jgi:hypothetical protein
VNARRAALLALALAPACSAPGHAPRAGGHPWAVEQGGLRIEARYCVDQARVFGSDLAQDHRLLPVALRVGRADGVESGPALVPDDMQLTLHLADGTALPRVAPESAGVRRRRMERLLSEGFDGGVLAAWEDAEEGFVYFALPERLRVDSASLRVVERVGDDTRSLELGASLLTFEVVEAGVPRTFAVGLALDPRGAREE